MTFSHRSSLKKQNKPFKGSKSKIKTKGKICKVKKDQSKVDRKNAQKLEHIKKNLEIQSTKKLFSGARGIPKIVALVPLCKDVSAQGVLQDISGPMDGSGFNGFLTTSFQNQKIQFIPTKRHIMQILDAVKVADLVVFILSAKEEVDGFGEKLMSLIKSQGVPATASVIQFLDVEAQSSQNDIIKSIEYYMHHHFTNDHKVFSSSQKILRFIKDSKIKVVHWRDRHSYMIAERLEYIEGDKILKVSGIVRGAALSANRLLHISNLGDFQIEKITSEFPSDKNQAHGINMDLEPMVLHVPDAQAMESLESQNEPDPMEGEQTWPTEEEIQESENKLRNMSKKRVRKVPKGTSSYQAAWIIDSDHEGDVEDDETVFDAEMDSSMKDDASEAQDYSEEEYEQVELDDRSGAFDSTIDPEQEEKEYFI
jgi:pre-rRNA-processing protein TSR1